MTMLRARLYYKGEDSDARGAMETTAGAWYTPNAIRKSVRYRFRPTRLRCVWFAILLLVIFWGYAHSGSNQTDLEGRRDGGSVTPGRQNQMPIIGGVQDAEKGRASQNETGAKSPSAKWTYPLVDRTMLDKLDRMQQFYAPEYYHPGAAPQPAPANTRPSWPPKVTRIPERPSRPPAGAPDVAICASAAHPRPCRFLLPLRIAEQESKARIHLTQLAHLARALNRTLVLPNVGKSKVGACFRWELGAYYDVASLAGDDDSAEPGEFVEQEGFRAWLDVYARSGARGVRSQLVSIGSAVPAHTVFRERAVHSNPDVEVLGYGAFGAWERELPGCFASKLDKLALETMPVFMSTTNTMNKDGSVRLIGDSVVEAFSAISSRAARKDTLEMPVGSDVLNSGLATPQEPEVLVVNWDLRHPIFPSPAKPLQYSKRMHDLAATYAPGTPYLVVQWRIETVNPELLEDCAHALVDVLSRVLHDFALAENVTTVWFASDYPYPIVKHSSSQKRPAVIAKSGTFRDFEVQHEDAIDILRKAFVKEGELSNWVLTDFAEAIETNKNVESELLQDSGTLGILDKLVSINANLFVSGASRCSRRR